MHSADELEAFRQLIANGKCVADVAARFGVSEAVVNKRLALARVSPILLQRYRNGEMNLELLQAFTLTDDQDTQEQIWNELQPWDRNPDSIRRMLSGNDIPASDKRVRFVGLARYEAEGGLVRRDLFHEGEEGTYILDAPKLTRLVNEKLESVAGQVKADGWKWVEVQPEADHQFLGKHKRMYAPELPLPPEAEAEIAQLQQERGTLTDQLSDEEAGEDSEDRDNEEIYDRIEGLDDRIRSIRRSRKRAYTEEVKAACGVLVSVGLHGEPECCYGLLRKEDEHDWRIQQRQAARGNLPRQFPPWIKPKNLRPTRLP